MGSTISVWMCVFIIVYLLWLWGAFLVFGCFGSQIPEIRNKWNKTSPKHLRHLSYVLESNVFQNWGVRCGSKVVEQSNIFCGKLPFLDDNFNTQNICPQVGGRVHHHQERSIFLNTKTTKPHGKNGGIQLIWHLKPPHRIIDYHNQPCRSLENRGPAFKSGMSSLVPASLNPPAAPANDVLFCLSALVRKYKMDICLGCSIPLEDRGWHTHTHYIYIYTCIVSSIDLTFYWNLAVLPDDLLMRSGSAVPQSATPLTFCCGPPIFLSQCKR